MGRRVKPEEERSLDSLLDALTNVVGILLLILVITSLGLTSAVKKIVENLPVVTKEQLEEKKITASEIRKNLPTLQQTHDDLTKKVPEETKDKNQIVLQIEEIEKNNKDLTQKISDRAELQRRIDEAETKKKAEEAKLTTIADELAKLKAALDQTPKREVADAQVVKMPNPRIAPEQATAHYVVCKGGRIYYIGDPYDHVFGIQAVIDQNFAKLAQTDPALGFHTFSLATTKRNDAKTAFLPVTEDVRLNTRLTKELPWSEASITEFDAAGTVLPAKNMITRMFGNTEKHEFPVCKFRVDLKKVQAFFGDGKLGPKDFKYYVSRSGTGDKLKLSIGFKEQGGSSVEVIKQRDSEFEKACKAASVTRRVFFFYYVDADSFPAYLDAREVSEAFNIPAGWTPFSGDRIEPKASPLRTTVKIRMDALPLADYAKIGDTTGPALLPLLDKEVKEFAQNVEKSVPADLKDPAKRTQFITDLTTQRRDFIVRTTQPAVRQVFEGALAAREAKGEAEVQIDAHPPEIPFVRIFVPSNPPSQPAPPPDPNAPKPKPAPPAGSTRLILD